MATPDRAPIVVGTDFSEQAQKSAELALVLAQKLGVPLQLVHGSDDASSGEDTVRAAAKRLGPGVVGECLAGHPDEVLVERAAQLGARLLVVGSLGRRSLNDWLLGSTAERVVRCSRVPCLVVRQPERLAAWLAGTRPLRAMVAVSLDDPVQPSFEWLASLSPAGPVDRFAVLVAGGAHLNDEWFESEVDRLQKACGLPRSDCHVEVGQWSVEEHLLRVAGQQKADLIVMGRHLRTGLERLWRGSTSMGVLKRAELSVASIPAV